FLEEFQFLREGLPEHRQKYECADQQSIIQREDAEQPSQVEARKIIPAIPCIAKDSSNQKAREDEEQVHAYPPRPEESAHSLYDGLPRLMELPKSIRKSAGEMLNQNQQDCQPAESVQLQDVPSNEIRSMRAPTSLYPEDS